MSVSITQTDKGYWEFGISGTLRKAELDATRFAVASGLAAGEGVKVLIQISRFQGWSNADDWSDISFATTHGDAIGRMAVVGEAQWEAEALMFMGAGYRKSEIKYFPDDQIAEAKAWLLGETA